jgi:hypothetical protein
VLAAQAVPVQQDEPIHTLHVYTNLIQIPTLVFGPQSRAAEEADCGEQIFGQYRQWAMVSRDSCSPGGGRSDFAFDSAGREWGFFGVDAEDR